MNIAMLSMYLPNNSRTKTGGVFYFAHNLANALVENGHQVTLITLDKKPNDAKYLVKTIDLPKIFKKSRFFKYYIYPLLINKIDFSHFDIIHSNGDDWALFTKTPLLRVFMGSALEEAKNSKTIIRRVNHYLLYFLEKLSEIKSNCTIGISKNTLNDFKYTKKYIYCAISNDFFDNTKVSKTSYPSILFVGTLEGRKRGKELIKQFINEVVPAYPNSKLFIVAENNITHPNIISFTAIPNSKLIELYKKSWIFCLPSSYEGFGIPYVEALASECYIVSTPNLGVNEILDNGKYGIITDINQIGKNINNLFRRPQYIHQKAKEFKKQSEQFKMDNIVNQYINIYKECITNKEKKY